MEKTLLAYDNVVLDTAKRECRKDNENVELTYTEYSLLKTLLEHQGNVVTAKDLYKSVWEDEVYLNNNDALQVHICHLRGKLGKDGTKASFIKTVRGKGYTI